VSGLSNFIHKRAERAGENILKILFNEDEKEEFSFGEKVT
jgi:hypothetical protein